MENIVKPQENQDFQCKSLQNLRKTKIFNENDAKPQENQDFQCKSLQNLKKNESQQQHCRTSCFFKGGGGHPYLVFVQLNWWSPSHALLSLYICIYVYTSMVVMPILISFRVEVAVHIYAQVRQWCPFLFLCRWRCICTSHLFSMTWNITIPENIQLRR